MLKAVQVVLADVRWEQGKVRKKVAHVSAHKVEQVSFLSNPQHAFVVLVVEPRSDNEDLIWVYEFTQRPDLAFKIGLNKITEEGYVLKRFATTEEYVCHNQICLANTISMSILANGDCSVCEMLYDNPEYLLGNVCESTIKEIWNSEKALQLYTMSQGCFPQSSPCKKCEVFEQCRNDFGKRVCYLDISKSGKSKWFPDPRCPHSEDNIDIIL